MRDYHTYQGFLFENVLNGTSVYVCVPLLMCTCSLVHVHMCRHDTCACKSQGQVETIGSLIPPCVPGIKLGSSGKAAPTLTCSAILPASFHFFASKEFLLLNSCVHFNQTNICLGIYSMEKTGMIFLIARYFSLKIILVT